MFKRFFFIVVAAGLVSGASCPNSSDPNNNLVPRPWSEAYGKKDNTSFNAVNTQLALPPFIRWVAPVGYYPTAPVIGPDGIIWMGDGHGELVGINPDGTLHRRRKLDDLVEQFAAPAVNPATNEIFVLGTALTSGSGLRNPSRIYRLDAGASLLAASSVPMTAEAAPKLWGNYVFVPVQYPFNALYVLDQQGLNLFAQADASICFNLICTGVDTPLQQTQPGSVAIIDRATVVGDPNKPIVVMIAPRCANAFRFDPMADQPLTLLWSKALVSVDCDFNYVIPSSPLIMSDGTIIVSANGHVLAFNPFTGDQLWDHDLGGSAFSMASTGLREIYIPVSPHLVTLDSNGMELNRQSYLGIDTSAAVSFNHVYVASSSGLHTFGLASSDPTFTFDPSTAGGTFSSAAIAEDGTIYVTGGAAGQLFAYSTHGVLAHAVTVPVVSWQTPTDGAIITSAPGNTLTVSVSGHGGDAFQGSVSISSNLDGILCDKISPSGSTATCFTSKVLSIGTHTLTAFATDSSGGTQSAAITVQVVDTPPTVAIISPTDGGAFSSGDSISFTAQVTDPDQVAFDADKIQWHSSIDGNIGMGQSLSKTLSIGTHTISATANDQSGMTGTATVMIIVNGV